MAMGHAVACGLSLNELCQITLTPLLNSDSCYSDDPGRAAWTSASQRVWNSCFLRNPVAFQQAVEFSAVDAKDAGGAGLVAVLLAENRDDVSFLKIVQTR